MGIPRVDVIDMAFKGQDDIFFYYQKARQPSKNCQDNSRGLFFCLKKRSSTRLRTARRARWTRFFKVRYTCSPNVAAESGSESPRLCHCLSRAQS